MNITLYEIIEYMAAKMLYAELKEKGCAEGIEKYMAFLWELVLENLYITIYF